MKTLFKACSINKHCVSKFSFAELYLVGPVYFLHYLFPDLSHMSVCAQLLSSVWLFVTPWTVARQAPLSMGFSRQEYCTG